MKEKIIATFRWIEGGAYIEIDTHHFKGTIIVRDHIISPSGNPVIPDLGEVVDGQKIEVHLADVGHVDQKISLRALWDASPENVRLKLSLHDYDRIVKNYNNEK